MPYESKEQVTIFVLVVDDFDDVRELYVSSFAEAGFEAVGAAHGGEAVALASSRRPDAIVMDLQMPVMDGFEATQRIRAVHGVGPYMLAVSAHAGDGSRREAYRVGFDDVVNKPIEPGTLIDIVRAALRGRRSARVP